MRIPARIGTIAALIVCAAGLAGCRDLDKRLGITALVQPQTERPAKPVRKVRTVVTRVTGPKVVQAGVKIRNFCGERHVRFQAGTLNETEQEKARNDVLCSQLN